MDGTLVDTNFANFLSYKKAINSVMKNKIELNYNSNIRFNRDYFRKTFLDLDELTYKVIIQRKESYYYYFLPNTKLNSKLIHLLLKYKSTNKIILVTNAYEDRAKATLKYHRIINKFDEIFYRSNTNNKYKNAISKLGVSPELVVLFEDENEEIQKAKQIGIKTIIQNY